MIILGVFLSGAFLSFINYLISKAFIKKGPEKYVFSTVIHQIINIAFILSVWFLFKDGNTNIISLLLSAVFGLTVPSLFFTSKILQINKSAGVKEDENRE